MTRRIPRAKPADPLVRLKWAAMASHAHFLARWLAAGLELFPGQEAALSRMPPSVQAAILSHEAPKSRYIPAIQRNYDAKLADARAKGRLPIRMSEWAARNKDPSVLPERITTIELPANAPFASRIYNAIATEAGVSPATIRSWLNQLHDALEAAEGVNRKAWERRLPRATRQSE